VVDLAGLVHLAAFVELVALAEPRVWPTRQRLLTGRVAPRLVIPPELERHPRAHVAGLVARWCWLT
jgi:hypothetical protein